MAIRRREFLWLLPGAAPAQNIRREVFVRSPRKGVAVMAFAYYTRATGGDMVSVEQRWSRSDTIDVAYIRRSSDHGHTWSEPVEYRTGEKTARGMLRRHPRGGFVDARGGRYLDFWNEGVLPSDDPLEGLRQWNVFYRISRDGGKTFGAPEQVIQLGEEYSPKHSLPGVHSGKNAVMLGDVACVPLATPDGGILLPVVIFPLGPDGRLYNPTGGYTYSVCAVVHGRWNGDRLQWKMSQVVEGDPARSTRGMDEPTLAYLDDGRMLMVMRGSNDKNHALPGRRWVSFSSDGGHRWTRPETWTYTTGENFFSPSSCSQLLKHSNGRLFWLGNLNPENPKGNRPRYPFVIGEVDRRTGLLRKETIRMVDTLQPGESSLLTLSNFYAREDRETGGIALHMTRMFALSDGWEGDAMLYRIGVA